MYGRYISPNLICHYVLHDWDSAISHLVGINFTKSVNCNGFYSVLSWLNFWIAAEHAKGCCLHLSDCSYNCTKIKGSGVWILSRFLIRNISKKFQHILLGFLSCLFLLYFLGSFCVRKKDKTKWMNGLFIHCQEVERKEKQYYRDGLINARSRIFLKCLENLHSHSHIFA